MEFVIIAALAFAAFLFWRTTRPAARGTLEVPPTPPADLRDAVDWYDEQQRQKAEQQAEEQPGGQRLH